MQLSMVRDLCREAGEAETPSEGLVLAERALAMCRISPGSGHYAFPLCLATVGALREAVGDRPGAGAAFAELVPAAKRVMDTDPEHALVALAHAERFYREAGRQDDAAKVHADLLYWTGAHLGLDHPRYLVLKG